jgi:uncharacterized repeat protein (TIGR01451 family)
MLVVKCLVGNVRLFFRRFTLGLIAVMLMYAPAVQAESIFGITTAGIFSVDATTGGPATQLVTFAATLAAGVTLATRPSDGMIFYFDSTNANPNLWRWNPNTPSVAPVLVGTPGATTTGIIRLGFDAGDNLYAMNSGAGTSIWTLSPSTGAILTVTPANGPVTTGSGDLCLHPSTGVLYMVAVQSLYTVDAFGTVTLVGAMTGLPGSTTGCAFATDGSLITSPSATLYKVNIGTLVATAMPVATGASAFGDLSTAPNSKADLSVTKTANNLTPGNAVQFTVQVTNSGPYTDTDVRVLDLLPAGLTFVSATPSQGSYSNVAVGTYPAGTWRVGALGVGATATLTLNANVTGTTPITNWAQVSYADQPDPDSTPGSTVPPSPAQDDQASVTITPSPDIGVTKVASSSFAVGTNATYSITVNNTLGSLSTGANTYTVIDNLPTGLTLVSAVGTGWNCAASTVLQMSCSSSTAMAAGASNPNAITLTVLPAAGASPSVTNTATVSGGGEPSSNAGNNSSTISTTVCATSCPDLKVNKTLSVASLTVGVNTSVYTLSVSNVGGLSTGLNNYVISDTLPTGLTLAAVPTAGAGWTCTVGAVNGSQVTCNSSTAILPGGTSTTITFPVNVANTAAPSVTNTASITGGGEPANATGNNSTSLTTPVIDFDLTITKTSPVTFALGSNGSYTLTVNNIGAKVTSGIITVTDTLPAGLTFVSGTGTGWTACTASGQVVTCTRAAANTIAANSSAPAITLTVSVIAAAAPSVSNTASVSDPNEAPNLLGNNSSATVVTPVDAPNVVVTKSHNGNFTVGTNGVYTITASNIGAQATTTATLTVVDTLPTGLTFVSATGSGWTCALNTPAAGDNVVGGQRMVCTRTTAIAANTSAPPITLTVAVAAAAASASPVTNNVSVSGGGEPAGNAVNNSDSDITNVYYSPVISKAFAPTSIPAGGTSVLTLTITNPAGNPVSLAGLSVNDPFPTGMSIAATPTFSNTCGGTISSGNTAGDTLISLSGGATGAAGTSCTITVNVTSVTTGANVNTTGQVSSTNSGTGNTASATLTVTAPGSPTLTKISSPNPIGVNQPATLTFTINNKATTTNDMGFTDTLPAGVKVATPATFSGTCASNTGAALVRTATAGGNTIVVSGVDLAANATCTIIINITSATAGSYLNTGSGGTPNITGLAGGLTATALSDTLVVQTTTLTKSFTPATVQINTPSTLTFTITNGANTPSQNGLNFLETLPSGLVVASLSSTTQCSGTVTAAVGGTITANVTSTTAGVYNNVPANVTGVSANIVNNATATLTVTSASLIFKKTVSVTNDPINGTTNPKNIPGANVLYNLRVTNTGAGGVDNNTVVITDSIPVNTELFVGDLGVAGSGPIEFLQGTPTSNLTWTYIALSNLTDDVDFSNDGGISWNYVPTASYDPSVTTLRLNPKGAMAAASGGNNPYFELHFRVRIK